MPKSQPQRKILCACGCGQQVTHATQRNHLQGKGKMALRARIFAEHQLLQPSTSQQPQMSRKPSNSALRQTQRKTPQVHVDMELMELPDPASDPLDADPMSDVGGDLREAQPHSTERVMRAVQQRWGNNPLQDEDRNSPDDDGAEGLGDSEDDSEDDDPEDDGSEDDGSEDDGSEDDGSEDDGFENVDSEDGDANGVLDGSDDLFIPGEALEREVALEGSFVLY